MKYRAFLLITVFFFQAHSIINAQKFDPAFKSITVEDGLTQNSVTDLLQDYEGFIWIATEDGLNRYDGFNIEQFRQIPHGKKNISVSRIGKFEMFGDSILWIQTYYNGYNYTAYHKKFGFKTVYNYFNNINFNDKKVESLFCDLSKNYWIVAASELNNDSTYLITVTPNSTNVLPISLGSNNTNYHFFEDSKKNIWITDNNTELIKASIKNNKPVISKLHHLTGIREIVTIENGNLLMTNYKWLLKVNSKGDVIDTLINGENSSGIRRLFSDSKNIIWGSYNTHSFFSNKNNISTITEIQKSNYLNNDLINSIVEDKNHNLWMGTTGEGILFYDRGKDSFEQIVHSNWNPNSLGHNYIDKLFIDNDDNIWAGTLERGISIYVPGANKFTKLQKNPVSQNSLSENIVRSIAIDKNGHYWFATRGGGITEYNPPKNKFNHHFNNSPAHFESLCFENDSILWIGTREKGILRYNIITKNSQSIALNRSGNNEFKQQKYVRKIYMDNENNLWFCTWGGLIKINPRTNDYSEFSYANLNEKNALNFNIVYTILQINKTEFLIGTEAGILKIDKYGNAIEWYQHDPDSPGSLSNNTVFSITRDSKGRYWAGTFTGGLNLFDPNTKKFKNYRTTQGLPNDCIYGILEDNKGNLWISTNSGLCCFNPDKETFTNFFKSDGLPSSAFNFGAYFKTNENKFVFGTEEGIVMFNPDNLLSDEYKLHKLAVTGFQVYNSEKELNYFLNNRSISLNPGENVFSINLVSPNYSYPDKINYEYKIEPLYSEWIDNKKSGNFIFNNLPHGKYTMSFRVKSVYGEENPVLSIPLKIKPPFIKTTLFKLLIFFAIIVLISLIFYVRFRQLKALEKIRLQIAGDLHDEIGSTISNISFYGHKLTTDFESNEEIKNYGSQIQILSKKTADSIREILWFINPRNDHISKITEQMKSLSNQLFQDISINFKLEREIPDYGSLKTKRNLFLIYKEIITNIYKHAQAKNVNVNIRVMQNTLVIRIFDNGVGFDPKLQYKGLGLKNIRQRVKEIKGDIEIHSGSEIGSTFIIKIPWKKKFRL